MEVGEGMMVMWVLDVTQGVRSFARQARKVRDLDIFTMLMSTISMSGRDCVAYGGRKDGTFVALLTILGNATTMLRQLILQHFCLKNLQIWKRHFCRKILQTLVLRKLLWEFCDTSATL